MLPEARLVPAAGIWTRCNSDLRSRELRALSLAIPEPWRVIAEGLQLDVPLDVGYASFATQT